MAGKVIALFVLFLTGGLAAGWEAGDINGTYLWNEEHLSSPYILEYDFSWGKGLTLPETAIEFDLGKMEVRKPGMGLYFIESIYKDESGSFRLVLIYVADKNREFPLHMKITFIDSQRVFIVHDRWERSRDRSYSPEAKWVWYRLSGP